MKVSKPVVVFDLETTGTWIDKDKIIEIAMIKVNVDGSEEEYHRLLNPGMSIPGHITELTGINDDDVADEPFFKQVAGEIVEFIGEADLGGYNVRKFDVPFLQRELNDVGMSLDMSHRFVFDAQTVFHVNEKRDLTAAYQFYCQKELQSAHSAAADTRATLEVLKGQIERYSEDHNSLDQLKQFEYTVNDEFYDPERRFRWWNGELYMMFGKYARTSLKEVAQKDTGYLEWILNKDFNDEVKEVVQGALKGEFPTCNKVA